MKRKLIEIEQKFLIECDNITCDYKVENPSKDPNEEIIQFLNKPCPKCGDNLLTVEDYIQSLKMMKIFNWINKWFSWITIFYSKKAESKSVSVKVHKGINIQDPNF